MNYDRRFKEKPSRQETAMMQGYYSDDGEYHKPLLVATTIDIRNLAEGLADGATFRPGVLSGRGGDSWVQQQLFALDFDHDTTVEEELARCEEYSIRPCFGYTTFSHTDSNHHFRLIFCSHVVITDIDKRNRLQDALMTIFKNSDPHTNDPARLFYGGRGLICGDYDNRINADEIIRGYGGADPPRKKKTQHRSRGQDDEARALMLQKVEAIKSLDVGEMKRLLSQQEGDYFDTDNKRNISSFNSINKNPPHEFGSKVDLYEHICDLDLSEYLGIYGFVNCILPEHEDKSPSAHIYITDDRTPIYKCLGCGKAYTIISITEKLAGCQRSQAIRFIKDVYNLKLCESDWEREQRDILDENIYYLDSRDFALAHPTLHSLIRHRKSHLKPILMYFRQHINDELQINGKPLFFASYDTLIGVCGIYGNRNTIGQTITLFNLLGMLKKVSPDDVPANVLARAKEIAARYGHKKLTNFFTVEEYGTLLFEESEERAVRLKLNNYTLAGLSREYILRTFGVELANQLYPQYCVENAVGPSDRSDRRTEEITRCISELIDASGYATEVDIIAMHSVGDSRQKTSRQIRISLTEILRVNGLKRVRANKELKDSYNIAGNGYPIILIRE
jgi:hypothetical protein